MKISRNAASNRSWKIQYQPERSVLHVTLWGTIGSEQARQLAFETADAAAKYGTHGILADSRKMVVARGSVFDALSFPGMLVLEKPYRVAIVHQRCPKTPEIFRYMESVYEGSGASVHFFTRTDQAASWLNHTNGEIHGTKGES